MTARADQPMLTLEQLSVRVGWPVELVKRWWEQGMLPPPEEPGPEPRWRKSLVERWLAGGDE